MTDDTWQMQLMARNPELFTRLVDGRLIRSGYPAVGDGWQDLVETAINRIAAAISPSFTDAVTVSEIKEKYGTLRLYADIEWLPPGTTAKVEEAIDLAEARSACTCDICGAVGRLHCEAGWYATRCDEHARGDAVPIHPGWDNLLVTYAYVGRKLRVVSCRRYDRSHDAFVDALPPRDLRDREG